MKKRFTIINIAAVLAFVAIVMASCDKNPGIEEVKVVVKDQNYDLQATSVKILGTYEFPSVLKGIVVNLSEHSDLSNARELEATIDGYDFIVSITGLEGNNDYYYCYVFNNGHSTTKSDVYSFHTKDYATPMVTTADVTSITMTSAVCGGTAVGESSQIIKRGICWGRNQNPNIYTNPVTDNGSGTGSFVSQITGLEKGKEYYVRAYVIIKNGDVIYGGQKSFTTQNGIPDVRALLVYPEMTSAVCTYAVYSDGGSQLYAQGICWGTSNTPTIYGNHNEGGNALGEFQSTMTGLTPGHVYYVRAYAQNEFGIFYSEPLQFSTHSGTPSISGFKLTRLRSNLAELSGWAENDGGNIAIQDKGICWGTNPQPTLGTNNYSSNGSGVGSCYAMISNLSPNTTYYARCYVRYNNSTYYYSDDIQFRTPFVGAIAGKFSVSASVKVCFSIGNLEYKSSKWYFAEDQWVSIGDNGQGSSSSTVQRDLFGWGTSGYNHNNACYQPWAVNTVNSKYWAYNNAACNLFDGNGKAEWGYNSVVNGGNTQASGWRTLRKSEWAYLLLSRPNADQKVSQGKVGVYNGLILLPDNWTLPEGLSFVPHASDWTTNSYTAIQWYQMEAAGAVFLPAAGCRAGSTGTTVEKVNTHGYYWASSLSDDQSAYVMTFNQIEFNGMGTSERHVGRSVRLVKNY